MEQSWDGALLQVLVPSKNEVLVSVLAAVLTVVIHKLISSMASTSKASELVQQELADGVGRRELADGQSPAHQQAPSLADLAKAVAKRPANRVGHTQVEVLSSALGLEDPADKLYHVKFELLAARNLSAANLNGTSDPYAVLVCGDQKRFSSVIPATRNPVWGETFDFIVEDFRATVKVEVYDWDIIWKSTSLGSVAIGVTGEGTRQPEWYSLDTSTGQIQVQMTTTPLLPGANGKEGVPATPFGWRRRRSTVQQSEQVATEVRQKPGPLQTIFGLPPDEVVQHTFSCAMERSFLYHGRMYVSNYHICFHSNIFSKGLKVSLPLEDVDEVKKSQHAFINPAISILMRHGAGGHGVPPLAGPDGRAKYKFASFWNRNHVFRVLGRARLAFDEQELKYAQEQAVTLNRSASLEKCVSMRVESPGPKATLEQALTPPPRRDTPAPPLKPFLHEQTLTELMKAQLPVTAQEFFELFYSDESEFTKLFREDRKDTDLSIESWCKSEEFGGLVRKITFRALCTSPMCPPDSAMTDWQHVTYDDVDKVLVFESVSQAHDVPFGSYFEVENRWRVETAGLNSCNIVVYTGVNFKKWLIMQGKIKGGAQQEMKADWSGWLELATKEVARLKEEVGPRMEEKRRTSMQSPSVQDEMLALVEPTPAR